MRCKPNAKSLRAADGVELISRFANQSGGLRTGLGGDVQGAGSKDTIPAKYTPGEFVVSNDMLDAQPELRQHLRGLREEVLAAKGMTPEQADAKAMGYDGGPQGGRDGQETGLRQAGAAGDRRGGPGETLRASSVSGASTATEVDGPLGVQALGSGVPDLPRAEVRGGHRGLTLRAKYGFDDLGEPLGQSAPGPSAKPLASAAPAPGYTPPKIDPATGRYGAPPTAAAPAPAAAPLVEPKPSSLWGKAKNAVGAVGSGVKSVATGSILDADVGAAAGRTLRGASSAVGGLVKGVGRIVQPVMLGASAAGTYNTPTEEYAGRMGTQAGDGLLKDFGVRGVGALADYGDMVTAGHATKLGNYLAGSGYVDNDAAGRTLQPTARAAPTSTTPTAPKAPTLREPFTDEDAAWNQNSATKGYGQVTQLTKDGVRDYSNLRANPYDTGHRNVAPSNSAEAAQARSLRDSDEQRLQAGYARTEQDRQATLERQALANRTADTSAIDAQIARTPSLNEKKILVDQREGSLREFAAGQKNAVDMFTAGQTNRAQLEQNALTNQSNTRRLQYDMAKDERSYKDGRYDKHLEQDSKASDQAGKALDGIFDTVDPKTGQVIKRDDLKAQANLVAQRASGGKWGTLSQAERDKHVGSAVSYVSILDSARKHQNNGWMQELGLDNPDAPMGGLPTPEDLSRGKLERVGLREGLTTPNTGKGDYALRLPGGRVMYLGSDLSGEHLKYLQDQGVK